MKKKTYFIISGVIQIIASIYVILNTNKYIQMFLDSANTYPESLQERITNMVENSGATFIYTLAIICILMNILIIYHALKDNLIRKKEAIIIASVVSIFTSFVEITELLAIANIIIMASMKRDKQDLVKKEIPKLTKENVGKTKIINSIILLLFYFSEYIWSSYLPEGNIRYVIIGIFYLVLIILSIYIFSDTLKRDFKSFKENFSAYIKYIGVRLAAFYGIYLIISLITITLAGSTPANQEALESLPYLFVIPAAVIYAPIVEECLFRGCLRRLIKNDKVFIIISGIIFGLLHTINAETSIYYMFLLGIPYIFMGCFLAYIYTKTNNMLSNISCHCFNNTIAMFFSILVNGL